MTQVTIKNEGAFENTVRTQINANFDEIYAAVISSLFITDSGSVAAAGSNQGTAASLAYTLNNVTAADGTKGVILPTATTGTVILVYNSVATNGLPIYPATSGTINGGSANAAITIEGKTLAILVATDTTNWAAIFTADT